VPAPPLPARHEMARPFSQPCLRDFVSFIPLFGGRRPRLDANPDVDRDFRCARNQLKQRIVRAENARTRRPRFSKYPPTPGMRLKSLGARLQTQQRGGRPRCPNPAIWHHHHASTSRTGAGTAAAPIAFGSQLEHRQLVAEDASASGRGAGSRSRSCQPSDLPDTRISHPSTTQTSPDKNGALGRRTRPRSVVEWRTTAPGWQGSRFRRRSHPNRRPMWVRRPLCPEPAPTLRSPNTGDKLRTVPGPKLTARA